jgi:hypothetical protein
MRFLIGIDDTDNPKTSSTGFLAQRLCGYLEKNQLGRAESITRHQLWQSPQILHTSNNSSICVTFEGEATRRIDIEMACRSFILREYCSGANAGFAFCAWVQVTPEVFTWARSTKNQFVQREEAIQIARAAGIAVAGLTGSGAGIIGALAAVGLRFRGEDGRFLWLPNMQNLKGVHRISELLESTSIDRLEPLRGRDPRMDEKVMLGEWIRPVLKEGHCVLMVEPERKSPEYDWHLLGMDEVRKLSS